MPEFWKVAERGVARMLLVAEGDGAAAEPAAHALGTRRAWPTMIWLGFVMDGFAVSMHTSDVWQVIAIALRLSPDLIV